jgi:hypothetical protein
MAAALSAVHRFGLAIGSYRIAWVPDAVLGKDPA